jgi:PAS domain S-box-containing protein
VTDFEPDTVEELAALVAHSTDIITVMDDEGTIRYQSPSVEDILGYGQREIAGDSAFEYVHPEERSMVWDLYRQMVDSPAETTEAVEFRFRHADGGWVWLESVGSNQQHSALDGYVVNSRDVSERLRMERRFRHFVRHSTDIINVIDESGTTRYVSPSVTRVLGYEPEEQVGVSPFDYVHPDDVDEVLAEFERGRSEPGYTTTVEYRFRHADGHWVWIESRGQSLPDAPMLEGSVVVNSRDVTDRRETEARLRRKNEQLEAVTSIVSHDLRNPLSVATGHLELAAEECDSDHLGKDADAHDRIRSFVEDLLTAAGEGVTLAAPTDLALPAVTGEAWGTVDTGKATLVCEADDRIVADRHRLAQLFENLYRNAVEHAGPAVNVTVDDLPDGFVVADDGPGIPVDDPERLFHFGVSGDGSGTGLGLYIVEQVASAHGWTVDVAEGTDGGTRFEITGVERPVER